jgi:2-amino-4-hydroxy-6-hydroxymethyldihydropteridine diphosphokinase
LGAALTQLDQAPFRLLSVSPIIASAPIGPSLRTYANAAALLETSLEPEALLARLKEMEKEFGRRGGGARWRARVLDLDILLWSEGPFAAPALTIPHIAFRDRAFVLGPLSGIAGDWRDPISGLSVRHLKARLDRKAPAA